MKQTLTLIFSFFIVLPLLLLSYQLGTPKAINTASIGEYFNQPALSLAQASAKPQEIKKFLPQKNPEAFDLELNASSALAWDFKQDLFLFSKNIDEVRPIASLTKMVMAAVVLDYAQPQETAVVSAQAIKREGDSGNLKEGEILTIQDLLAGALLESSNDAAYALAEHMGNKLSAGSSEEVKTDPIKIFTKAMNQKFNDLGLGHSNFMDPAGLEDVNSFSTASDFSKFIKYLRNNPNYATIWKILGQKTYRAESQNNIAVHDFKTTNPFFGEYDNVIGGKTGYTVRASGNMLLVVTGPNNTEIIYLVLGSPDRFGEIKKLIEWVNQTWTWPVQK